MKRKINRSEMRQTVLDLIDLGFTVKTVAMMLNKTDVAIYQHLKSAKRMSKREVVRQTPGALTPASVAAMRKVFATPETYGLAMFTLSLASNKK